MLADSLIYASGFNALTVHYRDDEFRQMELGGGAYELSRLAKEWNTDFGSVAAAFLADSAGTTGVGDFTEERFIKVKNSLFRREYEKFSGAREVYNDILDCLEVFPTAEADSMSFDDSFGGERTFGGKRKHEGTDIMPPVNERGIYPVLSVCGGTIEKVGWLTLGGYRLGVRSDTGIYFYYAHLQSYAGDFKPGDRVKAGEILGLMGDSGYGAEGTVGEFDVHLHFGIYISDENGNEMSVNPYPYLLYLKEMP
ncbi:MAG: M23 family metallopeptidase [Butyrivibrio sp.]|nr:M23 family metallopeptidase [Butyrivibrio sp.]